MSWFVLLLTLGLVNWLVTTILVESEITRPVRDWVNDRYRKAGNRLVDRTAAGTAKRWHDWAEEGWWKARYLVSCHLCSGTWVGLVMGAVVPVFDIRYVGWVLSGLAYKAYGHFTLEVVGKLKERHEQPPIILDAGPPKEDAMKGTRWS